MTASSRAAYLCVPAAPEPLFEGLGAYATTRFRGDEFTATVVPSSRCKGLGRGGGEAAFGAEDENGGRHGGLRRVGGRSVSAIAAYPTRRIR